LRLNFSARHPGDGRTHGRQRAQSLPWVAAFAAMTCLKRWRPGGKECGLEARGPKGAHLDRARPRAVQIEH
jgi:hypothetical protein